MNSHGFINRFLIFFILLVLGAGVFGWYYFFKSPRVQLDKARTPDNSLNTNTDSVLKKTEIIEKGYNSKIFIYPSNNDVISGEVTIEASDLPEGVLHVGFSISSTFEDLGKGGPNIGFDSDGSDGWKIALDTNKYENGIYYLALFAFDNDTASNPVGVTNVKVQILN